MISSGSFRGPAPHAWRYSLTNEAIREGQTLKVIKSQSVTKKHYVHVTQGHLPAQCKCANICKQVRSPPGPEQWEPDQERKLQLIFHRCLAVHTMHTGTDKYTMTFDTEDTFMLQLSNRGVGLVLWRELDRTTQQKIHQFPATASSLW